MIYAHPELIEKRRRAIAARSAGAMLFWFLAGTGLGCLLGVLL
jgi:hypothetical protein